MVVVAGLAMVGGLIIALEWIGAHPLVLVLLVAVAAVAGGSVLAVRLARARKRALAQRRLEAAQEAQRQRVLRSGIEQCDRMSGAQFEQRIALTLEALGAEIVQAGGGRRDGGADVVAHWTGGARLVVQCKRYAGQVGWDAVKEASAARQLFGANRAAVATNSYLNEYARSRAQALEVEVWDRAYLIELFERAAAGLPAQGPGPSAGDGTPEVSASRPVSFVGAMPCPSCGERGYSWGPGGPPTRRCSDCGHIWSPPGNCITPENLLESSPR